MSYIFQFNRIYILSKVIILIVSFFEMVKWVNVPSDEDEEEYSNENSNEQENEEEDEENNEEEEKSEHSDSDSEAEIFKEKEPETKEENVSSLYTNYKPSNNELTAFAETLSNIKNQIDEVNSKLLTMNKNLESDTIETKYGLSYYEAKQHLFISYLTELIAYLHCKTTSTTSINDNPLLKNLHRLKAILEKSKIIDMKLKPQIDRLISIAETKEGDTVHQEANLKPMLLNEDDEEVNSEEENENEEERQNKIDKIKKDIRYQVNQRNIQFVETKTEKMKRKKQLEADKERLKNSELFKEMKAELSDKPKVVGDENTFSEKFLKEIHDYENEHMVNINITKKMKKMMRKRDGKYSNLNNFDKELKQISNVFANDNKEEEMLREEKNKFLQKKRLLKNMEKSSKKK